MRHKIAFVLTLLSSPVAADCRPPSIIMGLEHALQEQQRFFACVADEQAGRMNEQDRHIDGLQEKIYELEDLLSRTRVGLDIARRDIADLKKALAEKR